MNSASALWTDGRGALARAFQPARLRLGSGLVLFLFVVTHYLNHAAGLIGVDAMESVQDWRVLLWRSPVGGVLLYGAFAIHIGFALVKVARIRSWRMTATDAAQIVLGFLIPVFLVGHIVATRGLATMAKVDDFYTYQLRLLWPDNALWQSALLLIVWVHSVIGVQRWIGGKRWYPPWRDALLAAAVAIPLLSLAGFVSGAREVSLMQFDRPPLTAAQMAMRHDMSLLTTRLLIGFALLVLAAAAARTVIEIFRKPVQVTYSGGPMVRVAPGATLLEISRIHGIAHASACGGRARCSTCRVHVLAGMENLPEPTVAERAVLDRVDAPRSIRLACQLRPRDAITVRLLVPPGEAPRRAAAGGDAYRWGVERPITVLFCDLRDFTRLSEHQLPFDVVFLLNRYLGVMTAAVERSGGVVDKYLGDGAMALFGLEGDLHAGAAAALAAARDMEAQLALLNEEFSGVLGEALRMGVGMHSGAAILGRIGGSRGSLETGLTALGDTVNVASRLEAATKELGVFCVCSDATVEAAGEAPETGEPSEIMVRGRAAPLAIWAIPSFRAHAPVPAFEDAAEPRD